MARLPAPLAPVLARRLGVYTAVAGAMTALLTSLGAAAASTRRRCVRRRCAARRGRGRGRARHWPDGHPRGRGHGARAPAASARLAGDAVLVTASCALTAAGLLGIMLTPMSAPFLWVVLLGLGQNAAFPLALMLIVLRGGSVASTEGLSTLAQSVGYVLAAAAPLAVGAIHELTDSWTPALLLLLALVVPQLALGMAAGRDRQLAATAGPPAGLNVR